MIGKYYESKYCYKYCFKILLYESYIRIIYNENIAFVCSEYAFMAISISYQIILTNLYLSESVVQNQFIFTSRFLNVKY